MRKSIIMGLATVSLMSLAACQSEQADQVEDNAEAQADAIEEMADEAPTEAQEEALDAQADAVEDAGEEKANAMDERWHADATSTPVAPAQ